MTSSQFHRVDWILTAVSAALLAFIQATFKRHQCRVQYMTNNLCLIPYLGNDCLAARTHWAIEEVEC